MSKAATAFFSSAESPSSSPISSGLADKHAPEKMKKKRVSGYILFYKDQYPKIKQSSPGLSLGDTATDVGLRWANLGVDGQAAWNSKAAAA